MKIRKTFMVSLLAGIIMASPIQFASAAVIEDQPAVAFYQNGAIVAEDEIQAGEVKAKVRIASEEASQDQPFRLILAAYAADRSLSDISFQAKDSYKVTQTGVEPSEMIFETDSVTVPTGGSAKLYVWKDMVPAGEGTGIIPRSTYCLSSIKIGDYDTAVDIIGKRILVKTDADISTATVSDVKLPQGATYQMSSGNTALTVTWADGSQTTYPVLKNKDIAIYHFDGKTIGALTTNGSDWYNNTASGTTDATVEYVKDPLDNNNTVIRLSDQNTNGQAIARLNVAKSYPYVVSYRVMYAQPNAGDDISYSAMRLHGGSAKNYQSMAGGTASSADGGYVYTAEYNGTNGRASKSYFALDTWHEISLAFIDQNTVKYYADGKLFCTAAPGNVTDLASLRFTTHKSRTCTVYLDDVLIRDYYLAENDLIEANFTDDGDPVDSYTYNDTIYVNASSLTNLNATCTVSAGATYSFDKANSKITVTSSEGQSKDYVVAAKTFFSENFSAYQIGASPATTNSTTYEVSTNTDTSVTIQGDNQNQYLRLFDNSGSNYARARLKAPSLGTFGSYIFEYDVRYGLPSGTNFDTSNNNPYYAYTGWTDGSNLAIQPVSGSATALKLRCDATSNTTTTKTIQMDQWYRMRIVYKLSEDKTSATVSYYLNGEALAENKAATVKEAYDYMEMRTPPKRYCTVDYDNMVLFPIS